MSDLTPSAAAIARLRDEFAAELTAASGERELQAVRDKYLARKGGVIAALMRAVAAAGQDERPGLGRLANELKTRLAAEFRDWDFDPMLPAPTNPPAASAAAAAR